MTTKIPALESFTSHPSPIPEPIADESLRWHLMAAGFELEISDSRDDATFPKKLRHKLNRGDCSYAPMTIAFALDFQKSQNPQASGKTVLRL